MVQFFGLQNARDLGGGLEGLQRVPLDGTPRIDDQARGIPGGLGFRQEGVNGTLGYGAQGFKELALDGAQSAVPLLAYEVDTRIRPVPLRPFIPHPHLGKAVPPDVRFLGQGRLHQALKGAPLAVLAGGTVTQDG